MLLLILYVAPQLNPLHLSKGAKYPKQNCAQFWIPFCVFLFLLNVFSYRTQIPTMEEHKKLCQKIETATVSNLN